MTWRMTTDHIDFCQIFCVHIQYNKVLNSPSFSFNYHNHAKQGLGAVYTLVNETYAHVHCLNMTSKMVAEVNIMLVITMIN